MKDEKKNQFTWSDKEDPKLYKNGKCIAIAQGRTKAIQRFVEALSYKINSKCDFAFTAGRAHIDVMPEAAEAAIKIMSDSTFMSKFLYPYSEEAYENETYFEICN